MLRESKGMSECQIKSARGGIQIKSSNLWFLNFNAHVGMCTYTHTYINHLEKLIKLHFQPPSLLYLDTVDLEQDLRDLELIKEKDTNFRGSDAQHTLLGGVWKFLTA